MAKAKKAPKRRPASKLGDSAVLSKLDKAAKAAGMSMESLATALIEACPEALPKAAAIDTNGIVRMQSLQSVGDALLDKARLIHGGNPEETRALRAAFFDGLALQQQVALILSCKQKAYTSDVIGNELGITPRSVSQIYNEYAGEVGAQVAMINVGQIIGLTHLIKEQAQQGLLAQENYRALWTVQRDWVEMLQKLGVIDQAARRVEINVTFDERKQEELTAMLELEKKRQVRMEEIKQIALIDERIDALPEIGGQ